jgi:hypothetical protein
MSWYKKGNVIFTHKAVYRMNYHHLLESDVLSTLQYPHSTKKASGFYSTPRYQNDKDFGTYKVSIVYQWNKTEQVYVIITCWAVTKGKKGKLHTIKWWWAHFIG